MWNIRMRASKKAKRRRTKTLLNEIASAEMHISGAEGIYEEKEIAKIIREYTLRALKHPKGKPDRIVLSLEELKQRPRAIESLPLATIKCRSSVEAVSLIRELLTASGISGKAIRTALRITDSADTMRGAALVLARSGRRVEPDRQRGIRASRLGISRAAQKILSRELQRHGIDIPTVREAITLASKVAACRQVIAELCISDDPGYTTGYAASKKYGYVRIPHVKTRGEKKGGRVFFLEEDAEIGSATEFLERTPVIIHRISPCFGTRTLDEIIDRIDK
ncbi:MAG: 6-carboxyhexanoate--CoA ligase [Nitrospirota bacterium]|nr:6-carboxyhexanoate--CoA ligase [Nitrospirota bacterium]